MPETEAPDAEEEAEEESPVFDDEEYLREKYHEDGLTQAQIAEEHDITASTVSHYMSKYGVETRGHQVDDERLDDPEWLAEQYVEKDRTMQDIADEADCSDGTVMRRLREHGIIEEPEEDEEETEAEEEETDDEEETEAEDEDEAGEEDE